MGNAEFKSIFERLENDFDISKLDEFQNVLWDEAKVKDVFNRFSDIAANG